ncbi:MAG: hypothetical protein QM820_08835 [Minicystis sp.]
MKRAALLLPLVLAGCTLSTQDHAVVVANTIHDIAATEGRMIHDYCVPRYRAAQTKDEIARIDAICLPAQKAYLTAKTLWEAFATTVQLAKIGKATEADVVQAAALLSQAYADLRKIMEGLR